MTDPFDSDRPPDAVQSDASAVQEVSYGEEEFDGLSVAVVEAVARAIGVPPNDMATRLYDVVDPDALERVFESRGDERMRVGGRVTFSLGGRLVVVDGADRRVLVYERDEEREHDP